MSTIHAEGKDIFVTVAFFNENNAPVTPLTASYRVTKGDNTELLPWTSVGAVGTTAEIVIPAQYNVVLGQGTESRHVAVRFTYGTGPKTGTAGLEYRIQNLKAYA